MGLLPQKVCVITGAAGSIGLASARMFLAEGARVMLVDLHAADLKRVTADLTPERTAWHSTRVGRLGSIAGPLVGGLLLGRHIPMQQLFVVAATPMVAGLTASAIAARLCHKRLGAIRLDIGSNAR